MTARWECPTPGPAQHLAARVRGLVPVIETERLTLRAPCLTDFATVVEVACSDRGRFIGGPMSREDAWFEFTAMNAGWMLHGHGGFTIEATDTGEVLGFVVLGLEPGDNEVELGFTLTAAAEGNGYATEAARAIRDWAARALRLTGLVSYIDPDNARSIAVATRLGATRDPDAEAALDTTDTHVFRHPKTGGLHD